MRFRHLWIAAAILAFAASAFAQSGPCRDPWINQAYQQLYHRAPQGSGATGECNISLYGGGHWSSFADLENKIRAAKGGAPAAPAVAARSGCNDPWINQAYQQMFRRAPQGSGATGECNISLYGGGHWSSFADLENKIRDAHTVRLHVDGAGALRSANGGLIAAPGFVAKLPNGSLLSPKPNQTVSVLSAGVIAAGGGNVIAAGGGNVIAAGGGNIIAAGGGNMTSQRSLMSVDGGPPVIPVLGVQ